MLIDRRRTTGALLALTGGGVLLLPVAAPAQAAEVDLQARMVHTTHFPNARGSAEYEAEHGGREFEIHVAGVRRLHGRLLTVRVHGTFVGRMRVTSTGRAHLDKHRGVPTMRAGNVVRVRTSGGTLVTHGTLRRHHDDDHDD